MSIPGKLPTVLLLFLLLFAGGCSINKLVADNMGESFRDTQLAFDREGSVRHAREAIPALLKMLDGFIVSSPENSELLLKGAEMNASFAFGMIEEEDRDWARELYAKSMAYGRRALALENEELDRALDGSDEELRRALAEVTADEAEALFWTAFAWGGRINVSRGDARLVADLSKVVATMERLCELIPDYFHAGPHLFLAVYYSSRGSALGGDVKKAYVHYKEVFGRTGGKFLMAEVLFARFYCVALGEKNPELARSEYTRRLEKVLAAPLDLDPDNRLQTALAKKRAKKLLPELDDYILPPLPPEYEEDG